MNLRTFCKKTVVVALILAHTVPVAAGGVVMSTLVPRISYADHCVSPERPMPNLDGSLNSDGRDHNCVNPNVNHADIAADNRQKTTVSCQGWWNFFWSPVVCIGRTISATIGTLFISLAAWVLQAVGAMFNWLLYYTVIAFGDRDNGILTESVRTQIDRAWTFFRDLSNILIIGLFVFIAISIILGLSEFGQKKMIARALIVAILINFSLLFTKMIIDASNFVAFQFYNATHLSQRPGSTAVGAAGSTEEQAKREIARSGVSGRFLTAMGITGVTDTFGALRQGADATDSGITALIHAVMISIILFAAAAVLLYGSVLLVTRAVVLVILIITSALAFATFLIPRLSDGGSFGWKAWWSALLKNAAFAPLLLILLWVAATIADAQPRSGGSLGALMSDPRNAGNAGALMHYLIVLGLLFAAIKISSSLSSSMAGSKFALGTSLGITSAAGGILARQTMGRYFTGRGKRLEDEAKGAHTAAREQMAKARERTRAGDTAGADKAIKLAKELERKAADRAAKAASAAKIGDRKFNLAGTSGLQALAKAMGAEVNKRDNVKGFATGVKEKGKHAAEIAEKTGAASKDEIDELRKETRRDAIDQGAREKAELEKQKKGAEVLAETVMAVASERRPLETEERDAQKTVDDATSQKDALRENHNKETRALDVKINDKSLPQNEREAATATLEAKKAEHAKQMNEQEERIKTANQKITELKEKMRAVDSKEFTVTHDGKSVKTSIAQATKSVENLASALSDVAKQTEKNVRGSDNRAQELSRESAYNIAGHVGHHEANVFEGLVGVDHEIAQSAREQLKSSGEFKNIRKALEGELSKASGGGHASAPAAAPHTPPTGGGGGGHH